MAKGITSSGIYKDGIYKPIVGTAFQNPLYQRTGGTASFAPAPSTHTTGTAPSQYWNPNMGKLTNWGPQDNPLTGVKHAWLPDTWQNSAGQWKYAPQSDVGSEAWQMGNYYTELLGNPEKADKLNQIYAQNFAKSEPNALENALGNTTTNESVPGPVGGAGTVKIPSILEYNRWAQGNPNASPAAYAQYVKTTTDQIKALTSGATGGNQGNGDRSSYYREDPTGANNPGPGWTYVPASSAGPDHWENRGVINGQFNKYQNSGSTTEKSILQPQQWLQQNPGRTMADYAKYVQSETARLKGAFDKAAFDPFRDGSMTSVTGETQPTTGLTTDELATKGLTVPGSGTTTPPAGGDTTRFDDQPPGGDTQRFDDLPPGTGETKPPGGYDPYDKSTWEEDPWYKWVSEQSQKQLRRQLGSQGRLYSTAGDNALINLLSNINADMADKMYNRYWSEDDRGWGRDYALAGLGLNASGQLASDSMRTGEGASYLYDKYGVLDANDINDYADWLVNNGYLRAQNNQQLTEGNTNALIRLLQQYAESTGNAYQNWANPSSTNAILSGQNQAMLASNLASLPAATLKALKELGLIK